MVVESDSMEKADRVYTSRVATSLACRMVIELCNMQRSLTRDCWMSVGSLLSISVKKLFALHYFVNHLVEFMSHLIKGAPEIP